MPPLLLDDAEAVAVAVALGAANASVAGLEETSLGALTKLLQVLPTRLRGQVDALQASTVRATPRRRGPEVSGAVLADLAARIRDREVVRFGYADHVGADDRARVEPYRLVNLGQRWYLVAHDLVRDDWRTFRVDRLQRSPRVGHRFRPRELPAEDLAAYVAARPGRCSRRSPGRSWSRPAPRVVEERIGPWTQGSIEPLGEDRCRVRIARPQSPRTSRSGSASSTPTSTSRTRPSCADAVRPGAERYARATG